MEYIPRRTIDLKGLGHRAPRKYPTSHNVKGFLGSSIGRSKEFNSHKRIHALKDSKLFRVLLKRKGITRRRVKVACKNKSDSVEKVLYPVFFLAHLIGLPFLSRFHLISIRSVWLALFLSFSTTLTILTAKEKLKHLGVGSIGAVLFYSLSTTYLVYLLWLTRKWPEVRKEWHQVEELMLGLPKVYAFGVTAIVTTTYTFFGLFEHALSILDNIRQLDFVCQSPDSTTMSTYEMYYQVHYKELYSWIEFAVWKGVLTSLLILALTVAWTFTDVFLMCMAIALASRIRQLYLAVRKALMRAPPEDCWHKFRIIYLKLYLLSRTWDYATSLLLLLSIGNNMHSICLMLLSALSVKPSNEEAIPTTYYMVSFIFVTMRLFGIIICAAKVNDRSRELLTLLYAVPSELYTVEVHRLVLHVAYEPITLTGNRFFPVTRSTLLTIAGTIMTYELVLVQFNRLDSEDPPKKLSVNCTTII